MASLPIPALGAKTPGDAQETQDAATSQEKSIAGALEVAGYKFKAPVTELAKWRAEFKSAIADEVKKKEKGIKEGSPLSLQMSKFALQYMAARLAAEKKPELFNYISGVVVKTENKESVRLAERVRLIVWGDIEAYAPGKKAEEKLLKFIVEAEKVKPDDQEALAKLAKAAEGVIGVAAGDTDGEGAKAEPCRAEVAKVFTESRIECAVVDALTGGKDAPFKLEDLIKDPADTKVKVKEWLREYFLDSDVKKPNSKRLSGVFKKAGLKDKDLKKFWCSAKYPDGTMGAAAGEKSASQGAMKQVKDAKETSVAGAKANSGDASKDQAGAVADGSGTTASAATDDPMWAVCRNWENENKNPTGNFDGDSSYSQIPGGVGNPVPEPALGSGMEAASEKKKDEVPKHKLAIAAGMGAIGFGLIGFLFGGPVGMMIGAAIGAAATAGLAYLNNKYG